MKNMKKILSLLLASTLLVSAASCAKPESKPEPSEPESAPEEVSEAPKPEPVFKAPHTPVNVYNEFKEYSITRSDGSKASFRMFVPDGYDKNAAYPVVLFLHGAGERGNDNRSQLINAVQNFYNDVDSPVYGSIFIVPQCAAGRQWVDKPWTPGKYDLASTPESYEMKTAMEILAWVEENYNVDPTRRYASGISMGGFGAWDLVLRHGDMFAGAVIMCGGGGDPKLAETVLDIPIYLVHSTNDDAIAYAGALEMATAIQRLGGKNFIFQKQNIGHGVWNYTSENVLVMRWLFSQKKDNI